MKNKEVNDKTYAIRHKQGMSKGGKTTCSKIWITKDKINHRIDLVELEYYNSIGYKKGRYIHKEVINKMHETPRVHDPFTGRFIRKEG